MLGLNLFQMLVSIYSLQKVWEVELHMILRDKVKPVKIVKPTISIWNRMFQNKNQNIIYLVANSLYGYAMSRFLTTSGFDSAGPKDFDSKLIKKQ